MSTILKALRRLETERQAQDERALRGQVVARSGAGGRSGRLRLPLVVASGAAGAALVVGAFVWWSAPPAPEAEAALRPAARVAVPAPAPAPALKRTPSGPRPAARADGPAAPEAAPAPVERAVPRDTVPVEPFVRRAASPPAPAPAPAPAARAAVAPGPVASPAPEPDVAPPPPEPAAMATRTLLPRVVVDRTVWHPHAERRLAILEVEGRADPVELREGDAVGDLVVRQIDPGGVVFLHRGIEIRHRIDP